MKVSELIALLNACDQDVLVFYVDENDSFYDIEFVENRLQSSSDWSAVVRLHETKPDWTESQNYEVEQISADYIFATTKYHDIGTEWSIHD